MKSIGLTPESNGVPAGEATGSPLQAPFQSKASRSQNQQTPSILVVDDDNAFRYLIAYHLHFEGYRALQAKPTAEARQLPPEHHPGDLLLTDFHLPARSGQELAQWFQTHFPATKLAVICESELETAEAATAAGPSLCFLSKHAPPAEIVAAVDAILAPLLVRRGAAGGGDLSRPTVLVVDDDESILILYERILKKHGYRVLVAGDAATAQKLAPDQGRIDLLVTDFKMPGMDGVQLARWFHEHFPQTKRLLVSSGDREFIGGTAGTEDLPYLSKTEGFEALVDMVGGLLTGKKG